MLNPTLSYVVVVVVVVRLFTVNVEAGEDEETVVKQLHNQALEKETVETQKMIDDSSPDDTELSSLLPDASHPPEPEVALVSQPTTGSSIPAAADDPFESISSVSLKCADRKPDNEKVFADRKLIVVRAADIRRSRSADIFRPEDDVATTSGPATARAQSETRDVIDSWNAPSKAQQSLALENLTSPVCAVKSSTFPIFATRLSTICTSRRNFQIWRKCSPSHFLAER